MTATRVIGLNGRLPWQLPDDLNLFKQLTTGGTVIMGQKTYSSIGRPLPGRHNIVLSRSALKIPGVQVCDSFMSALGAAAKQRRPVFVIGGKELYRRALPIAEELHISWVQVPAAGDTYFPEFKLAEWTICEEKNFTGFRYCHYRRRKTSGQRL